MTKDKEQGPRLIWPGKTRHTCRDVLPLHAHSLWGAAPAGSWRDLLIRADNRLLLSTLLNGPARELIEKAGGLKLVYIDPPFAVGANFVAEAGGLSALAYRDTWEGGLSSFLSMMHERLLLIRELLANDGSIYLHCDYRTSAHMRLLLDEVFGRKRFLGCIVWHYTGGGRARRWFSRKHDTIFHFARSANWHFNPDAVRVPYKPTSGYARSGIVSAAGKRYLPHPDGTPVDDVWAIPMINPLAAERTGYPTQKPEALLERILLASSRPGDLVGDFFGGSGTLAATARRLGRRWICADSSALAVHTGTRRLLRQTGGSPFLVASLDRSGTPVRDDGRGRFACAAGLDKGEIRYVLSDIRIDVTRSAEGNRITLRHMRVERAEESGAHGLDGPAVGSPAGSSAGSLGSSPVRSQAASPANSPARSQPCSLPDDWTDWLDWWSVGLPWEAFSGAESADSEISQETAGSGTCPETADSGLCPLPFPGLLPGAFCNFGLWQSGRTAAGPPALETEPLAAPVRAGYASARSEYIVTLADIFANIIRVRVPCTGNPQ